MEGFTIEQEQEYNKYKKEQQYFVLPANLTKVNTYLPLKEEVSALNLNIADLELIVPRKTRDTSGITQAKTLTRTDVANYWAPICNQAEAFAHKNLKTDLEKDMHHSRAQILHIQQGDVQPLCKHVNDVLTPFVADPLFTPYGITALKLSDGMALANAFKGMIGQTGSADADKTAANIGIEARLKLLRGNEAQFKLLITHYLTIVPADPDFVNGFFATAIIDDIGIHHTGIDGYVKDKSTGDFIFNATITNKTTNVSVHSNTAGFYIMQIMPPGDTIFEVSASGKKTITKVITLKRGKTIEMDWEMENV